MALCLINFENNYKPKNRFVALSVFPFSTASGQWTEMIFAIILVSMTESKGYLLSRKNSKKGMWNLKTNVSKTMNKFHYSVSISLSCFHTTTYQFLV